MNEAYYPGKLYEKSEEYVGDSHGIQHLIGCYYEYDDLDERSEEIKALDREVVRLAQEWVKNHDNETLG